MAVGGVAEIMCPEVRKPATAELLGIAAIVVLAHLLTNGRYGFHRDELQFLSDAKHLAWGFVAFPPLTPFVERVSLEIFGLSLVGLRLASVLAQATVLVVTGLMARELGGGRLAQVTAAVCVALSPLPLFEGTEFQYTSFDYLWWVLMAYCVIRLLRTENPRWWLAVGTFAGLGLMTKYSMVFLIAGILGGFLLTRARRHLLSRYFAGALALTVLICLPNLVWQAQHGFISYAFLRHIHARDVAEGRAKGFLPDQFRICTNPFTAPLWLGGLAALSMSRRYRAVAWMFAIPVAMLWAAQGRGYYPAAVYPMAMAMGAVAGERWLAGLRSGWRRTVEVVFFSGVAVCGAYACAIVLPLAGSGPLMRFALNHNRNLREEIGWPEIVRTVATIRDALPAAEREHAGILVGNYGEQGAIEMLGPRYHLPPPISGTNSAWLRGYPTPPPTTLIVLGLSQGYANRMLTGCRLAARVQFPYGVKNEESQEHPDIWLCGGPRLPWPEFWKEFQSFG